jgi:16S rRNA (uracil1498-N3)-methyltransferase
VSQRLYLPPELLAERDRDLVTLDRTRSHYLANVLRLKAGASLKCFDGSGSEWQAQVVGSPRRLQLMLGELLREAPAAATALILAVGWLKGAAMDLVVQKATELNASAIVILNTERSNVSLKGDRLENKRAHWQGVLVSAAEQSGRLHLPALSGPMTLDALLQANDGTRRMLLDPGAPGLDVGSEPHALTLLVGPEGGWSERERRLAEASGAALAGLGEVVLRAETAPLAALAAVRHSWGWQR